jgi:Tfp pilus assembly protein FimV
MALCVFNADKTHGFYVRMHTGSMREGVTVMAGNKKRALLARDIGLALNKAGNSSPAPKALLLTGLAIACLQPESVLALGLGEIEVISELGQPLVSTTTTRIGAGETLTETCLSSVATPKDGLGSPQNLKVSVPRTSTPGEYPVRITSSTPLYEPMYEIRVKMKCGNGIAFIRDYVIMLNLPMTSPQTQPVAKQQQGRLPLTASAPDSSIIETQQPARLSLTASAPEPITSAPEPSRAGTQQQAKLPLTASAPEPVTSAPEPSSTGTQQQTRLPLTASAPELSITETQQSPEQTIFTTGTTVSSETDLRPYTERFPTPDTPLEAGVDYQVQAGDMLSSIAQRIADRPAGSTYAVADQLFMLNPDAFIANDPNRLKMGSVLSIPAANELVAERRDLIADRRAIIGRNETETADTSELVVETTELSLAEDITATEINATETVVVEQQPTQVALEQPELAEATATDAPLETVILDTASPDTAIPDTAINAPQAATEPEILVDIREPLDPVFEIEATELEVAATRALTPVSVDEQAGEMPTASSTESAASGQGFHPLLIGGLLALLGFIVAVFLLGDRKLKKYVPAKAHELALKLRTAVLGDLWMPAGEATPEDANPHSNKHTDAGGPHLGDSSLGEVKPTEIEEPEAPAPEPELPDEAKAATEQPVFAEETDFLAEETDIVAEEQPAISDVEPDINISGTDSVVDLDLSDGDADPVSIATTGSVDIDLDFDEIMDGAFAEDIPSISTPVPATSEALTEDTGAAEPEATNTMRKLFSEEAETLLDNAYNDARKDDGTEDVLEDEVSVTQDLPALNVGDDGLEASIGNPDSLQAMAEQADSDEPIDELELTLTKALGMLEQDYEDELSASQILDKKEVEKALAAHRAAADAEEAE